MFTLERLNSSKYGVFGNLLNGSQYICHTCEDPWLENQVDISCIPNGVYQVEAYSSDKFPNVWQIMNVPGRTDILIHNGNTQVDTHGCILVGDQFGEVNGVPGVLNSVATLDKLQHILPASFTLNITSTFMMA